MNKTKLILYFLTVIVTLLLSFGLRRSFSNRNILFNADQTGEYELSDFYNTVGKNNSVYKKVHCEDVVIVSIDGCGIEDIPNIIKAVDSFSPKVIGLDVIFAKHADSIDRKIVDAIKNSNMVIVASEVDKNGKYIESPVFNNDSVKFAVANIQNTKVRYYNPQFIIDDTIYNSFAMELVKQYSPEHYYNQLKRKKESEHIRIFDFDCESIGYKRLLNINAKDEDLFNKIMSNKIVIIGTYNDESDMRLTSINTSMSGAAIHAAIIYTILNERYINEFSWLNYLIAVLVTFGFSWLIITWRRNYKTVGNLMIRILQVLSLLFGIYMGYLLYSRSQLYLDLSNTLLSVGLISVGYDIVFGFYEFITNKKEKIIKLIKHKK